MATNGYYTLTKGASGKYRFNLKAANHQTILTSQSYDGKSGAQGGIASVQANGGSGANFEKKTSSAKEPYFVLKSGNGQIIGTSEMYSSEAARDNGIASVIANSPTTDIRDETAA